MKLYLSSSLLLFLIFFQIYPPKEHSDSILHRQHSARTKQGENRRLIVNIKTDKSVYRVADTLFLETAIENAGKEKVGLYGDLSWGMSSSLSLWIRDSKGKDVEPSFLDDELTPPPTSRDQFFYLQPGHFFGVRRNDSIPSLNIAKPGKYTLMVHYHSPIPKDFSFGMDIWSREDESVESSPIVIEIR
jgi:hypothetical protein